MSRQARSRMGFTIIELLIVIAVIVVLIGLLVPALSGVWRSAEMTKSMNNLRQIALWMRQYSSENSEYILPSRFDYTYPGCDDCYKGKVCSVAVSEGQLNQGTWADILWTVNEVFSLAEVTSDPNNPQSVYLDNGDPVSAYRFNAPDQALYGFLPAADISNPLRSSVSNLRAVSGGTGPTPFGSGAQEEALPGFFAANNFFDSRDPADGGNGWYTTGQIKFPDQSVYLIDSFAGEVIEDNLDLGGPFDNTTGSTSLEVDFRYGDLCLILFLDGHVGQQGPWQEPGDLEGRSVRVHDLTSR